MSNTLHIVAVVPILTRLIMIATPRPSAPSLQSLSALASIVVKKGGHFYTAQDFEYNPLTHVYDSHSKADCTQPRKFSGACFNCGEEGYVVFEWLSNDLVPHY